MQILNMVQIFSSDKPKQFDMPVKAAMPRIRLAVRPTREKQFNWKTQTWITHIRGLTCV